MYYREVGLEVVREVSSRYGSSVVKYVKVGVYVGIDDNVGWGVYRVVGGGVCRGIGGEANMKNMDCVLNVIGV